MSRPVEIADAAAESPDAALVVAFREGDSAAFSLLMRRYKDRVYNALYRLLGNHEDAQDVTQEVFVRAYHGLNEFRGEARVYTWIYSIAINLARNRMRDRGRKGRDRGVSLDALAADAPGAAQEAASGCDTPRHAAQRRELDDALETCLAGLPELYRAAFVLRVVDGMSYEEIAQTLECPKGTVKSRLNQARSLLRACLEQRGVV